MLHTALVRSSGEIKNYHWNNQENIKTHYQLFIADEDDACANDPCVTLQKHKGTSSRWFAMGRVIGIYLCRYQILVQWNVD